MSDDTSPLASFSLTHIYYDPSDPLSHLCAWLALLPQALCVVYVTLVLTTREAEVALMFAGQMGCEAVNFALKRIIKEQRPARFHGNGYGMPSSHAQFAAFWAVAMTLFLLLRHRPSPVAVSSSPATARAVSSSSPAAASSSSLSAGRQRRRHQHDIDHGHDHDHDHDSHSLIHRLAASAAALALAALVAWSRIYLSYHTARQVMVGFWAGVSCAVAWFAAVAVLRRSGTLARLLQLPPVRYFRFRDLLVTEDICQAGWEKWEAQRVAEGQKKTR